MEMKKVKRYGVGKARRRGGAVLVEAAAATLFLLIPLLIGIIQFGLFYSSTNALSQATREGGRYAAVYGLATTDNAAIPGNETSDEYIKDRIIQAGNSGNIVIARSDITIMPPRTGRAQYQPITVTVGYDLNKKRIVRFFNFFSPGVVTRTSVSMAE